MQKIPQAINQSIAYGDFLEIKLFISKGYI